MMELKKFEAPTLSEALKVVKQEFGPEAVIISTRNQSAGLMKKPSVVVTAAISREALQRKKGAEQRLTERQKSALANQPSSKVAYSYDVLSGQRLKRSMSENAESPAEQILAESVARVPTRPITQRRYIDISDDDSPAELASATQGDRVRVSTSMAASAAFAQQSAPVAPRTASEAGLLPRMIAKLIDAGVQHKLVKDIGDELKAVMLREHINRWDLLKMQLGRILMSRVRVARPLSERLRLPNTPRIITFVGPTGVGKTTTVAKMAAELVINRKQRVVLATTDTFKIGAVEQLQTYANILNAPLEVCTSLDSFRELEVQLGADDVVLVDTAGYGPLDERRLSELRELLGDVRMETHLCLSATTRDSDLAEIVKRFAIFSPSYVVFTKLDETQLYGNVFNTGAASHLPLSYFTMGQRVPEDMEVATKERLADLILRFSEL